MTQFLVLKTKLTLISNFDVILEVSLCDNTALLWRKSRNCETNNSNHVKFSHSIIFIQLP